MGIKRVIDTDFWTDEKVVELFSPEDKYFFLYLLTNPHTTQLGVYPVPVKIISFETGYTTDTVGVLLDRLENKYRLIRRNAETGEIAIRNYLRHSIVKGGKPVADLLQKEAERVKDKTLVAYVCNAAKGSTNDTVRGFIDRYLISITITNDNENDNEESLPNRGRIVDDSSKTTKNAGKRTIEERHKYGEYKNVLLTEHQLETLKREFPLDWERRIETLSEYISMHGKKYKNHLAVIRNWARRDNEENAKIGGNHSGIGTEFGNIGTVL